MSMNKIPSTILHNIRIDLITKEQFLKLLVNIVQEKGGSRYVVTPYSEYVVNAQSDKDFMDALNRADISIADGIYVPWAATFMSLPVKSSGLIRKIEIVWQYISTGLAIILRPELLYKIVPERIPGSQVAYDIASLAAEKGYKLAILGGYDFGSGNTGVLAAEKLKQLNPGLEIVEIYPGNREKEETGEVVVDILRESKADILFCCYSPKREEIWLRDNLVKTGICVGIGLGGTIDYISGVKRESPVWVRKLGLEWLFRPFFADGYSLRAVWNRMKRGWIPAMLRSSIFSLREKLKQT